MQLRPSASASARVGRPALLCAAVLCVVGLAYAGALDAPFLWDDRSLILDEPAVQRPSPLASYFVHPFWRPRAEVAGPRHLYRPLVTLSYVLDRGVHGDDAMGYHATNLCFHLGNAALLFLLLRRRTGPIAATLAAALWALSPRLTESVTWISGRTDVLAATFLLGALLLWRFGASEPRRWAGALLLLLGLLCKEVAAAGMVSIAAGEIAVARRGLLRRLLPLACAASAYAALRVLALRDEPAGALVTLAPAARVLTVLEAIGSYVTMILDPWRARTQIGLIGRPCWPLIGGGALCVVTVLVGAVRRWRPDPEGARAATLAAAAIAPVLHVIPLPVDIVAADRFLYVPLLGLALLAAPRLEALLARRGAQLAATALCTSFAVGVHVRNRDWSDELRFWLDARRGAHRDNGRPLLELGNLYYRAGLYPEAMSLYERAAETARGVGAQATLPGSALGNAANCLSQLGRYDEAQALHRRVMREAGALPKHHLDLGLVLLHQGRYEEARHELRLALAQLPGHEATLAAIATSTWAERAEARLRAGDASPVERAELLTRVGRRPAAQAAWLVVTLQDPARATLRRAAVYLALFGAPDAAAEGWRRLRERAPAAPEVASLAELLEERAARARRLRAAWPAASQ